MINFPKISEDECRYYMNLCKQMLFDAYDVLKSIEKNESIIDADSYEYLLKLGTAIKDFDNFITLSIAEYYSTITSYSVIAKYNSEGGNREYKTFKKNLSKYCYRYKCLETLLNIAENSDEFTSLAVISSGILLAMEFNRISDNVVKVISLIFIKLFIFRKEKLNINMEDDFTQYLDFNTEER